MYEPDQQHTNNAFQILCLSHAIIAVTPMVAITVTTPDIAEAKLVLPITARCCFLYPLKISENL